MENLKKVIGKIKERYNTIINGEGIKKINEIYIVDGIQVEIDFERADKGGLKGAILIGVYFKKDTINKGVGWIVIPTEKEKQIDYVNYANFCLEPVAEEYFEDQIDYLLNEFNLNSQT